MTPCLLNFPAENGDSGRRHLTLFARSGSMLVLLLGKKTSLLVDTEQQRVSTQHGVIDVSRLAVGKKAVSSTGERFVAVQPTFVDLMRKAARGPQVVTFKDTAQIIAVTGAAAGWTCLDAGGGSGFLALFLAHIVKPGLVTTYEQNKQHCALITKNASRCGIDNITVKYGNVLTARTKKGFDLVTLDMMYADKAVKKLHGAVTPGGWFAVYSPHIEQQMSVVDVMEKFHMQQIKTVETLQREWKVDTRGYTHPKPTQVVHTGFITFGRRTVL